jgi:pimeloyl-ACP methyl ester carboxylesterase
MAPRSRVLFAGSPLAHCAALAAIVLALPAGAQERPPAPAAAAVQQAVVSKDGTRIVYDRSGDGPPLVIVASALATRRDASRLAALLADSFTVCNHDRRGRGDSGDGERYAVAREVEDIEAIVDAAGGTAFLFGSSSGAVLALEAAHALGAKVQGLVLFEPPFVVDDSRPPIPDAFFAGIAAHVEGGRRREAVAAFLQECVGVPAPMLAGMQRSPMWRGMEQLAHTLPYDGAVMAGLQDGAPLPKDRWTGVRARTLILDGERSDAYLRRGAEALAEVLPGAKRLTLRGLDHSAVFMAPQALVPAVVEFLAPRAPDAATGTVRAASVRPQAGR